MAISDFHASTIVKVRAYFGFSEFACDPDEITRSLGVVPDEVERKGQVRIVRGDREVRRLWNDWTIISRAESKDINDHFRELLARLDGMASRIRADFGPPSFSVLWKGNYLYAGSGPFYEADVIAGIAGLKAMLWQDIYQVDQEESEPIGPEGLQRIPKRWLGGGDVRMAFSFGDNLRVASTPLTVSLGLAGLTGPVHGATTPSVTGVEVIGGAAADYAINVQLDGQSLWFAPALLEFVDHAPGTEIVIGNKRLVRSASGEWVER
jgi:hypothetical protein